MTTPDDGMFLAGIDPVSTFRADVEAEVAVEFDRQFLGDLNNWKPEGFAAFWDALTRPAPGYREIANADGIRWHERIDPEGDDDDPR